MRQPDWEASPEVIMETRMHMRMRIGLTAVVLAVAAWGQNAPIEQAERMFRKTDYTGALSLLKGQARTPAVLFLEGRCLYYLADYKGAVETFEKLTVAEPRNGPYVNWLGKAWGRRAENANVFQAPGYASRAREAFEKAVAMDATHKDSLEDLFQYYLEAPGMLGGGLDKAQRLLPLIQKADPAGYHTALAQIAEKTKDYHAAESHLKQAAMAVPRAAGKMVDLARFLARRGRVKEAEAVFGEVAKVAPGDRARLYAQAEVYIETKTNQAEARKLLAQYLAMPLTPDDPPRGDAERLLKKLGG
jgi:tetratricopeptide (TPR) repeat protein